MLAVLDEQPTGILRGWMTVAEVAKEIYGKPLSRTQVESVRRAIKGLAAAGAVETDYMDELVDVRAARVDQGEHLGYRRGHYGDRKALVVHLLLSVEERDARGRFYRDSLDRLSVAERCIP